ncbi:HK97 family phage prohead protease [Streptomyces longwoodensis]|uniref:HK97 family phage prohead protease n=1 Tax=Streptomyces longwoodensis TaxID=68231 RepID=UPI002250F90F|nr:HK97 family phage prohead protease [Streptomyces longwoodensis]MCX4994267.1 HK97 family phage prohead protease [Streptomyces longwoodensis]
MEVEFRVFEQHEFRVGEDEDGTFEGVACQYGKRDSYGTTFHPGVFRRGIDKGSYAYLFMHSPFDPIGTFRADEQSNLLHIAGRYDDTQAGRDKRAMARSGSARELSVGFVRTDLPDWKKLAEMADEDRDDVLNNIRSARLVEVSQITARMAAVPGSKLKTVRSALGALYSEAGEPTLAERLAEYDRERGRDSQVAYEVEQERKMLERQRRAAVLRLTTIGGA